MPKLKYSVRSLKILETSLEPNHSTHRGGVEQTQPAVLVRGKYEEAEPVCKRALGILEKNLRPDDPALVKTRQNCSELAEKIAQQIEIKKMESRAKSLASPQPADYFVVLLNRLRYIGRDI